MWVKYLTWVMQILTQIQLCRVHKEKSCWPLFSGIYKHDSFTHTIVHTHTQKKPTKSIHNSFLCFFRHHSRFHHFAIPQPSTFDWIFVFLSSCFFLVFQTGYKPVWRECDMHDNWREHPIPWVLLPTPPPH